MSDEPITAYRRVRTMEGWAHEDEISTEMLPTYFTRHSVWAAYNHTRREYVSGAPWPQEATVDDNSSPPSVGWLCELRDRLWTSKDTGYQVLDVVIHYASMDGANSEDHSPGALSRDLQELRAEVAQLHQEVEFWTKGATTWRERALEYWDAGGEKQEEELVERVAKWAYSRSMDFLEDGPEWEALGSFVDMPTPRAEWLSQARAVIEGER